MKSIIGPIEQFFYLNGLVQSSYDRTKALAYMPSHTFIYMSTTGHAELAALLPGLARLGFMLLDAKPPFRFSNVRPTILIDANTTLVTIHHSMDGEVVTVSVQFLASA